MIFSVDEVRKINLGQQQAKLVVARARVQPGVRPFRREYVAHDADGREAGVIRDVVRVKVDDQMLDVKLTVLAVEEVFVDELGADVAHACGYRTALGLREAWHVQHPRLPEAKLVWFVRGDVRDLPLFLNWTGGAGGDYTRNLRRAMDEAEALTQEQMAELTSENRQKDAGRRARASRSLGDEKLSERVARLEAIEDPEVRALIRQNLRVISQRLARAESRRKIT